VREFIKLTFDDPVSWGDDELRDELRDLEIQVATTGCCEWKSTAATTVSIGWSGFASAVNAPLLAPEEQRTKLVLRESTGRAPRRKPPGYLAWPRWAGTVTCPNGQL
jgi:hypothetical protein